MNSKAILSVSTLILGFVAFAGVAKLSAAPTFPSMSDPIMMPEVTIMGELTPASIINLPEQFISASPSKGKAARGVNAPSSKVTKVRSHELSQGGHPGATMVKVIN